MNGERGMRKKLRASGRFARHIFHFFLVYFMLTTPVYAGAPVPDIPKGKGDECVKDTEYMRKNHMELLKHQRDETMYRGIRTKKNSLKECLTCHVVKGDDNKPISVTDPKHFCRVCHNYASVNIDCFDCHASKPRASVLQSNMGTNL